jgi:hypothetical protein
MKLYEKLPDSVMVNGKRVRLNLEFRNVIRMIDIMSEDGLMQEAREYLALKCICRHPKKGMMKPVRELLFPGAGSDNSERITDFEQDADLIRAAFLQEYGINLFRDLRRMLTPRIRNAEIRTWIHTLAVLSDFKMTVASR